jgi:hypothetical protein
MKRGELKLPAQGKNEKQGELQDISLPASEEELALLPALRYYCETDTATSLCRSPER